MLSAAILAGIAVYFVQCSEAQQTASPPCSFSTPSGMFDLSPLGTRLALSPSNQATLGWLFAFNLCESVNPNLIAHHCDGKVNASAIAAGTYPLCRVLGRLQNIVVTQLNPPEVGLAVEFGAGEVSSVAGDDDACGILERRMTVNIVCADVVQPKVRLVENASRPCSYIATVESRAGCPLACARDPRTGSVCGGADQGLCTVSMNRAAAHCECTSGTTGLSCRKSEWGSWLPNRWEIHLGSRSGTFLTSIFIIFITIVTIIIITQRYVFIPRLISIFNSKWSPVVASKSLVLLFFGCVLLSADLLSVSSHLGNFARFRKDLPRPPATCAFASIGSTFRVGGQSTLVEGAIEAWDDQITATKSQIGLLQTLWKKHGLVCDLFVITYNNSFSKHLQPIYENAWPHRLALFKVLEKRIGFQNLFMQVVDAALPASTLNSTPYNVLHYIRVDLKLKPYFNRLFDPTDADRILFASFINSQQGSAKDRRGYGKGRPWINEMAVSIPRKHFGVLRPGADVLRGQDLLGHGKLDVTFPLPPPD